MKALTAISKTFHQFYDVISTHLQKDLLRKNGIDCGPINHILSIPYIYVFILDVTHVSSILFFLGLKQSFYYNDTAKKVFIGF